jgi:hypothetical protein
MAKTPLLSKDPKFDLKFLIVGNSGVGKTHFCATYTAGPIHFYMLDPGGEKTLHKLNKSRAPGCEITLDAFSARQNSYSDFWKQIQKDEKAGFFDELAEKKGLIILPDSLSSANDMALHEVAKKNGRSLTNPTKTTTMRIQDWGQLGQWMKELVGVINDLPCAVATPAHLHVDYDKEGTIVGRYPLISGMFKTNMGRYFDEIYLLEAMGSKRKLHFKNKGRFQASSRAFRCKEVVLRELGETTGHDLQTLADAYMCGDDLSNAK